MYHQHRAAGANSGPAPALSMRVSDMLEHIKSEYEGTAIELSRTKQVNEELERKLEQQITELESIQRTLFDLQNNHTTLKQRYEEEILRLRRLVGNEDTRAAKRPKLDEPSGRGRGEGTSDLMHGTLPSLTRTIQPLVTAASTPAVPPPPAPTPVANGKATLAPLQFPSTASAGASSLHRADREPAESALPSVNNFDRVGKLHDSAPADPREEFSAPKESDMDVDEKPVPVPEPARPSPDQKASIVPTSKNPTVARDWVVMPPGESIELMHTLHHSSVVCCVRFSHDGRYLATGSNKIAQVFDVESGEAVASFSTQASDGVDDDHDPEEGGKHQKPQAGGDSYVRSVCFSPDNKLLVAGTEDKTIKMWDIRTKKLVRTLAGHDSEIYSLDYSPDGRFLVSGSGDKKAKIWNIETAKCEHELGAGSDGRHEDGVTSVCYSPSGSLVATGCLDRVVRVWDTASGGLVASLVGHDEPVYSVAFSPDGKYIASGSLDKTLKMWSASTHTCLATYASHSDYVLSVAFARNGEWLVSGSKDRTVAFWKPRTRSHSRSISGADAKEEDKSAKDTKESNNKDNSDGSEDGKVSERDMDKVAESDSDKEKDSVGGKERDKEGAKGGKDKSKDTEDAGPEMALQGHRNSVISVGMSPVDPIFATGSGDSRARIWRYIS